MTLSALRLDRPYLRALTQSFRIPASVTHTLEGVNRLESRGFYLNDVVTSHEGRLNPHPLIRPLKHRTPSDGVAMGSRAQAISPSDLKEILGDRHSLASPWAPAFDLLTEMRDHGATPGAYGLGRLLAEADEMKQNHPRFRGDANAYQSYRKATIDTLIHHERVEWEQRFWAYTMLAGRSNHRDDLDNYHHTVTPIVAGPKERILFAMEAPHTDLALFSTLAPRTHFLLREIQALLFEMKLDGWVRRNGNHQWILTEKGRAIRQGFHDEVLGYLQAFINDTIDPELPDCGYMLDHPACYWEGMGGDIEDMINRFRTIGLADEKHQARWHDAAKIHRLKQMRLLPYPSYTLDTLCEAGVITTSEADLIQKVSEPVRYSTIQDNQFERFKILVGGADHRLRFHPDWAWNGVAWIYTPAAPVKSKSTDASTGPRRRPKELIRNF